MTVGAADSREGTVIIGAADSRVGIVFIGQQIAVKDQ